MGTRPRFPSTTRTRCGLRPSRMGMASMSTTTPSSVSISVSSTSVPSRYRRRVAFTSPFGAMSQRPFSGVPRSEAKHGAESKRQKQSQSIDPSRPTSAAV